MGEVDYLPGIMAVVLGLGIGGLLALLQRGKPALATEPESRLADLRHRKAQLLEALRDLEDTAGAQGIQSASGERAELERRAAAAMRDLAAVEEQGDVPAPPPTPSSAGMSPQLRGMLQGGLVVGFVALLVFGLKLGTTPRTEGMGITGAVPIGSRAEQVPAAGSQGGAVGGVPKSLQPKPSDRVNAARATVAATPQDTAAWAELGYALVEAEGWIDVWNTAGELLKLAPDHPDGLVLQGVVRMAMGQDDAARAFVDQALAGHPDHLVALSYQGTLALRGGDREGAKAAWGRAHELAPGEGFDELVELAGTAEIPPRAAPSAEHPPQPAVDTAPAAAPSGAGISGTIRLADGAQAPPGGTLFLIARAPGVTRGPPTATRKMQVSAFPAAFDLGPEHVMMGGPFPASMSLSARLDGDGNAMTKNAGDLITTTISVDAGAQGVELVLAPQ